MYGATLLKEKGESKPILVMELCKENLMKHIFRNQDNVPGLSTTTSAAKNVIGWAKDISNALEFIHNKGIIHRDLKLENTLVGRRLSDASTEIIRCVHRCSSTVSLDTYPLYRRSYSIIIAVTTYTCLSLLTLYVDQFRL